MTTRVTQVGEFSRAVTGVSSPPVEVSAAYRNVTADIVDRAVEETFQEASVRPEVAHVVRALMGADTNSAVAHAYYHGIAAGPARAVPVARRRGMEIPYVLTDPQVTALSVYAADFDLRFAFRESHDHSPSAASRLVDRDLVSSRFPPSVEISDVGGAVLPLVMSGHLGRGVHVCSPVVDKKDPVRHVLTNLRVKQVQADVTRSEAVRRSARMYLDRDERAMCGKKVQDCTYKTRVLSCVHVYDIAMEAWPEIMEKKGAELVEGCLLFPQALFSRSSGEMPVAGARYEVDASKNMFRMGFIGSPAWWYTHRLSDYLKYGVDQVLSSSSSTYSYKIVERRGDTVFFRILRVGGKTRPEYSQVYRVPGVQMVRVNGFPLDRKGRSLWDNARRVFLFPRVLWEDMLGHAKEMVERGTLTHERLFNYYRTVAPRQSINAVIVAGGTSVDSLEDLVPLIVHVVLFAFLEVRKLQAETTAVVSAEIRQRGLDKEWTAYKLLAAFGDAVFAAFKLTCAPLLWVASIVEKGVQSVAVSRLYDWDVEPSVVEVSAKLVLPACFSQDAVTALPHFVDAYAQEAPRDLVLAAKGSAGTAALVLQCFGDVLPDSSRRELERVLPEGEEEDSGRGRGGSVVVAEVVKQGSVVDAVSRFSGTVIAEVVDVDEVEVERRKASILEAKEECEAESVKSEAACASQFRELLVGSEPNRKKLRDRKEIFSNPEFWKVTAGVIEASFSGVPVDGFQHAAVYCPDPVDGSRLLMVSEEEFTGMSKGEYVERVWYRIPNPAYTGWVYTNDSLLIHNGPAVANALERALGLPLDFRVVLNQGPPGCGKTSMIVGRCKPEDVVLVPVKKAARETADRIRKKGGKFQLMAKERTRTVDSYLVNNSRVKVVKGLKAARLLADEAFMTREGRWLAAAAGLGVSVVEAFGDKKQIPHVPRAQCPKMYVSIQCQEVAETYISYRCPPQSVACWGGEYSWTVRSASKVEGVVQHVSSTVGRVIPHGCVMMGMYQADKKLLQEKYAGCGVSIQIMTVHESEGNTYKDVWLHRFDYRVRTDNFSLYDKPEYVLVAMSRNTSTFLFVSPDLGDLVSQWIKRGKDLRRVNAARDVKTAGQSIEFV